jgi:hypothetical protein
MWIRVAILVIVLTGCGSGDDSTTPKIAGGSGGGTGSGGAGGGNDAAAVACQAVFDREVGCDPKMKTIEAEYLDWCAGRYACATKMFVPEYTTIYWPCASARACNTHDDECSDTVVIARYEGDPAIKQAVDGCLARYDECSANGNGEGAFLSDYCPGLAAAIPALASERQACLAKPCEEINACLKQTDWPHAG